MLSKEKEGKKTEFEIDLNDPKKRMEIIEFERLITPYDNQKITVMSGTPYARDLSGFWLYLHKNGIYRYTEHYPLGAVVSPEGFRIATAKYSALARLRDRREWAKNNTAPV